MNAYLVICAIVSLGFSMLNILWTPFLFGRDRGTYKASHWVISTVITVVFYLPLALHALDVL